MACLETRIDFQSLKKTMAGATGAFVTAGDTALVHPLWKTGAIST